MLVPETMSPKQNTAGHRLHCFKTLRGTGWRVQKFAGQRLRGPKLCGANIEANLPRGVLDPSTCAPQRFGPLNLCPAEFWSNATCAPRSFGDIVSGPKKTHKKDLKITFSYFFYGYFCKPLTFQRSIQPIWPLFREKKICGTVPLIDYNNLEYNFIQTYNKKGNIQRFYYSQYGSKFAQNWEGWCQRNVLLIQTTL